MAASEANHSNHVTDGCWESGTVRDCNLRVYDPGFRGDLSPEDDFRLALFIRRFEESLLKLFQAGHVNGTTHTCIGQEYLPVSLIPLLKTGDYIFSNHRGHGHYLARFLDPEGLMCEILGREGAVCGGVGGSQHIRRDQYYSTGIQGESVPVGAGVAMGLKGSGQGNLVVVFIGDGTWGEGSVYEALNMASLWSLPLVVVCENNGIAQTTPIQSNLAGEIGKRAAAFDIDFRRIEHQAIVQIRAELAGPLEEVRTKQRPLVIEAVTQRLASHSKGDDTRSEEEVTALRSRDWLGSGGGLAREMSEGIDLAVTEAVERLVHTVLDRPLTGRKAN